MMGMPQAVVLSKFPEISNNPFIIEYTAYPRNGTPQSPPEDGRSWVHERQNAHTLGQPHTPLTRAREGERVAQHRRPATTYSSEQLWINSGTTPATSGVGGVWRYKRQFC